MGVITRVAGTGTAGNTGDDGPATDAELNQPGGVAATADGGFLIADTNNNVVRAVSPQGVITRVAGTGNPGNTGDDGPATDAQLSLFSIFIKTIAVPVGTGPLQADGVAATADGGFLIADTNNNVVRAVSPQGVITRVAGTGNPGNTGDDGPATDAELFQPCGVAATADGGFLIADTLNHVVRAVSPQGVITRVAGTGSAGNTGDDGPATDAELNFPCGGGGDGRRRVPDRRHQQQRGARGVAAGRDHARRGHRPRGKHRGRWPGH